MSSESYYGQRNTTIDWEKKTRVVNNGQNKREVTNDSLLAREWELLFDLSPVEY